MTAIWFFYVQFHAYRTVTSGGFLLKLMVKCKESHLIFSVQPQWSHTAHTDFTPVQQLLPIYRLGFFNVISIYDFRLEVRASRWSLNHSSLVSETWPLVSLHLPGLASCFVFISISQAWPLDCFARFGLLFLFICQAKWPLVWSFLVRLGFLFCQVWPNVLSSLARFCLLFGLYWSGLASSLILIC